MGSHIVTTMRQSANSIDDNRAKRTAYAAVSSLKKRLSSTVRDNAVWTDAYDAVKADNAQEWIRDNWGTTSAEYPLYDGIVVTGTSGKQLAGYWKGVPFNAPSHLGATFVNQADKAAHRIGTDPQFLRVGQDLVVIASEALQPFNTPTDDSDYNVLSMFKIITPSIVSEIAEENQLQELVLTANPAAGLLTFPLGGSSASPVAYMAWPSKAPGTAVYNQVYPYIAACIALLAVFIGAVVFAGGVEARRLRKLTQHAQWQATHDSLTGLYNRLGAIQKLEALQTNFGNNEPIILHLLDLDGFKAVNDAWGHAVGDKLLVAVADALQLIDQDIAAVARLGGDEFALVQVGTQSVTAVAQKVLDIFVIPFAIEGRTIEVGGSIGIAAMEPTVGAQEVHRRADMALYAAKDSGRTQFKVYHPDLDSERERISALEHELRIALQSDKIRPLFQPLVSAKSGRLCGVEALARWIRPQSFIGPDIFIPLAERSGLIEELGLQILRKSLKSAKQWPSLTMSVNVSPIQLCNPNFGAEVAQILEEQEFDPTRLTLEITEGVLISNPDQAKRAIKNLKSMGVSFALDDFGSGYASIGALREFGFDRMKLDRSLVKAADHDGRGLQVMKATIALAAALGIPVTAEGIESQNQADLLTEAGCDQLQGYMLGKPMSQEDIVCRYNDVSTVERNSNLAI